MARKKSSPMNEKSAKMSVKKRNWAFVVYPESAPHDWMERLQKTGVQCAVSPLHDRDKDPTEEDKKPHYHVIVCYSGPTTFSVVKALTERLNAPIPQVLESVRGYYRYLTHKDNPEKYQYDENEIRVINGFSILDFVELTKSEVNTIKKKLVEVIISQGMTEYAVFVNYALYMGTDADFDVATSHTIFFNAYLTSQRHIVEMERDEMLRTRPKK